MATSATNTLTNMGQATAMKVIAKMAALYVRNSTVMLNLVSRSLEAEFHQKGDVITYQKPQRAVVLDGPDITNQIQSNVQQTGTMTVDKWKTVNMEWGPKEMALTPAKFFKEVMIDPLRKLPNQIDMDLLANHVGFSEVRGVAGGPIGFDDIVDLGEQMDNMSIGGERNLVLASNARSQLMKDMKGVFLPRFVNGIIRSAQLGELGNFQTFMDQNVKQHTQAAISGYLVNDTVVTGDSTVTIDTGTGTPAVGDKFYFPATYAVNPMNYDSTGRLKRFTVVSYAANVITFSPAIVSTGAYQNVDALPADNAAITFEGSHKANLGFTKPAIQLAMVPVPSIDGLNQTRVVQDNIPISIATDGDIRTMKSIKRLDVFYGTAVNYEDQGVVLMS